MKRVKCPICKREKEVEENVILPLCYFCQVKMDKVHDDKEN